MSVPNPSAPPTTRTLLLCLALTASLAACGDAPGESTAAPPPPDAAPAAGNAAPAAVATDANRVDSTLPAGMAPVPVPVPQPGGDTLTPVVPGEPPPMPVPGLPSLPPAGPPTDPAPDAPPPPAPRGG